MSHRPRSTSLESVICGLLIIYTAVMRADAQDFCGFIGNNNETPAIERRDQMFYLDLANPAPCDGRVMSWRVCYYGPGNRNDLNGLRSYWATYAVYRRTGDGATLRYQRVSEIFTAVRGTRPLIRGMGPRVINDRIDGEIQSGFVCYNDSLEARRLTLTVQAGDVVGACVFDPADQRPIRRSQLDVVGEVEGESLLAMNTNGCSIDSIPSDVPTNQLTVINSRRLHIYAPVGMFKLNGSNEINVLLHTHVYRPTNLANTLIDKCFDSFCHDNYNSITNYTRLF